MGMIDEETGEERKLSVEELQLAARELRAWDVVSIHGAKSGHPGGTLSIMDVGVALYLNVLRHKPKDPEWPGRDRVFWSTGHKAPALYLLLAKAGYHSLEECMTLRQLHSPFQGHPHKPKLPGVEVSSGSLGQGLGCAVGAALAERLDPVNNYRIYCIMGDGEQQEGSIWEAVMAAGHYKLDNLCGIVDKNALQIDGWVETVMNIDPLADKYRAFNWHVVEIDGHDMNQILAAFDEAANTKGQPTVIIAHTTKGKGVSFMENIAGWHGVATTSREQVDQAIKDIGEPTFTPQRVDELLAITDKYRDQKHAEVMAALPKFSRNYWWNSQPNMSCVMDATRMGFGRALAEIGDDERIVTIHADISSSIRITDFEQDHPERLNRVFSVGIAEQNMMSVAAGLALAGRIPITGTYGVFASGRCWDQIRTTICYTNLNVKIAGAHGGISVGPDGATHQSLEEISCMAYLPNMHLAVPCDALETARATKAAVLEVIGPAYIRYAREATPVVTKPETPYVWGKANVIRYRGEAERFADAFEIILAEEYQDEGEEVAIIACGPMVPEAMRAAWILKEDKGIETRVLNVHTVKPIDEPAILAAARDCGIVMTAEEHQVGGFGNIVAGVIAQGKGFAEPLLMDMIGVQDKFGDSGAPWDLMADFGLCAEHIAARALKLLAKR